MKTLNRIVALRLLMALCLFVGINGVVHAASVGSDSAGSSAADGGSGGGGGSASISQGDSYTAPSFGAAQGTDTVQLGSLLLGSISVSTDTRSTDLRFNAISILQLYEAKVITEEELREFAKYTLEELVEESKSDKCFGIFKCGKKRKLTNFFKLI